jgi:2-polyprenyl-6-methoxyphenol hydroxylase-like FAD-dependent oxidoreductase
MSSILIVGAGPVGLTLAAELARHGVRARIAEKRDQPLPYCRAIGVTPRTLEVWDDMGIVRPMIDAGVWITGVRSIVNGESQDLCPDLSDLPYGMLGLPQYETERLLNEHLESFGVHVERGVSLESLSQANGEVQVALINAAGERERATFRYVIGCDGAHSKVRHALEIPFEGSAFEAQFILGDVRIDWDLPRGLSLRAIRPVPDAPPDMFIAVPLPELGRYRVSMLAPPELASDSGSEHGIQSERPAPGLEPLQAAADRLLLEKALLSDLRWSSVFRISMRLAAHYRKENVFLAGDAAHIHPPTGGQGMNTGIQDAYNLAWKLALVTRGLAPAALLDSYEAERRPIGQQVVESTTKASVQLGRERGNAQRLADTQILVNYRNTPWVAGESQSRAPDADDLQPGDRAPDCLGLRRAGVGHPQRLFDVLRGPEHVLLEYCPFGSPRLLDVAPPLVRAAMQPGLLRLATIVGPKGAAADLPGLPCYQDELAGFVKSYGGQAACFLVRPDGYLAWLGEATNEPSLAQVLSRTFNAAS